MRSAAAIGIAKKIYDEARKPENQRRIKQAVASFQERRAKSGQTRTSRR